MSSRYAEEDRRYRDREGDRDRSGRDRDHDRRPSGVDKRRDDDKYLDRLDDRDRDRRGDRDERRDREHRSRDRQVFSQYPGRNVVRLTPFDFYRDRSPRPRHRSRSRSKSPDDRDRRRRQHKSRDSRSDDSSSSSGSDSEDSHDRERRRRKEKKRDKRDGRDKESREERKARKEKKRKEKKDKKKSKKSKSLAVTSQWGTYGIISEADRANKDNEFRAWLVEERTINPETLPRDKEKKEFLRFIEDFNTATLPSDKYYDMAKYEIKMRMLRTGEVTSLQDDAGYDPMKDLMSHNSSLKRKPAETDTYLNKTELEELRNVQRERSEMAQRKLLGMDISKNLGVRQEAKDRLFR